MTSNSLNLTDQEGSSGGAVSGKHSTQQSGLLHQDFASHSAAMLAQNANYFKLGASGSSVRSVIEEEN